MRNRYIELFGTFFKIGLFTFGGGYVMISLIEDEVSRKRGWISPEELVDVVAIAESTPGPIAINSATWIGYRRAGFRGSVAATLGVVLPSFIIIYIISLFLERFMALSAVAHAFRGIQVAVAFLIMRAGLRLSSKLPRTASDIAAWLLAAGVLLGVNLLGWRFSSIWLILLGGLSGLIIHRGGRAK